MSQELQILVISAASIGFFHTLFGPDHYLPFIMIGKAREWKLGKILALTLVCGIGHILSSVVVGLIGIGLEMQVEKLNWFESFRGNLAAWALIAFGLLYALWGVRRWYKNHNHDHTDKLKDSKNITPWVLFIIFALGPCEPLIPILMYPAAIESIGSLVLVTSVFGLVTLTTMTIAVLVASYGLTFLNLKRFENLGHPIAGFVIFLSGLAIQVLGL
ncbi:sulfite exporter TauE/SafE family protein [Carboxylicivirga sp. M1479]|uniref:urease accessory protein UreH domain-containing protein n=1 Tax=Carboxylicivirga sp. M1479 TaxID=2594476 RepID=UPI001177E9D6|nr:sulfite exporter TauE/SafE family protein [Carboxylicivirga sp. M1479]TRX65998.1 hypothetical protein FNN09_16030 [Carboxylicivirga sp. M1479]